MFKPDGLEKLILGGLSEGVYPGAAISVGDKNGELFRGVYGNRQTNPEKKPLLEDTLFDLASLTKILATTFAALKLIENGKLSLNDRLGKFFETPAGKREINIAHLMTHTSGLPAHVLLESLTPNPDEVCGCILGLDLLAGPGENVVYSCLGFILLGKICEKLSGKDLSTLAREWVYEPLGLGSVCYRPSAELSFAATEYNERLGKCLEGVVHDENARFLGGVSGNAGLFSDIADVAKLCTMLSNRGKGIVPTELFDEAVKNHTPHVSEGRGLGFAVKNSMPISCGNFFPKGSYGHTGFTGTSIWVNIETTQYVALLTNRVHPTRENDKLVSFRSKVHDCCAEGYLQPLLP